MTERRRLAGPSLAILLLLASSSAARAADPALDQAKTLYAAAAFEEALVAIGRVDAAQSGEPDVLLYKALCLLALGRPQEAATATRTLVSSTPTFVPETGTLPPRFRTLWTDTRKATLPAITREMFSSARARYQSKDYLPALTQFEQVLALADDPAWKDSAEATDIRTLASGFIDLAQAALPKLQPGPTPQPLAAAPTPPPPAPRPQPIVIEVAMAIRQDMPKWSPSDRVIARQSFDGAVRISIDAAGNVTEAVMVRPTHIIYDTLLLRAARDWRYRPALRNGQPIASEKVIEIHLGAVNEE